MESIRIDKERRVEYDGTNYLVPVIADNGERITLSISEQEWTHFLSLNELVKWDSEKLD